MIIRLLSAALVAGFLAAVVATGLQLALTSPLIVAAERYETHDAQASAGHPPVLRSGALPGALPIVLAHAHSGAPAHSEAEADSGAAAAWQPGPGLPRMAFTGLATLIGGVGYALLLGAVMLACGRAPTLERGLGFAVAGFLAVALAPALGLPPELPGSEAAPLAARQAWWLMTAASTAMGLYLIAIRRVPVTILGGLVLLVAPHVAGAPEVAATASPLPAGLAAQFAARSLAIAFVFWAVIGLAFGWAWQAFGRTAPAPAHA
ncbi:CbtA family protein [Methylobacterium planeticum]|uniref:Cobalt transporter n=1 Tax=Methylobacterium planeticum TaxID=2615211 RepID=A0A6N6MUU7_9HYPH|nr:CbtA family protein [Methylobacterium planeticum]KAB1075274.1 cobalt transporter [Methylobacterium planeticum]